jgi:acyl-CoA synthetase (NDP forming)
MTQPGRDDTWDSFFDPRVVCIVGASGDPQRIGGRLVRYSMESAFAGRIVPVNPNRADVFGIPTLQALSEVDERPDWVVVALPRELTVDAVREAAAVGARNVAVVASGFAESDATGRALQDEIRDIASEHSMRVLGPNSNGFMAVHANAFFAFTPVIDSARPVDGPLAVVTQSAAIGTYLVNWCRNVGIGIRHWVHTGNECDVTALEVVEQLALRGEVKAVALSFESLRDLPRLQRVCELLADRSIAVGVLQAGLSEGGRRASEAHTAALINDEATLVSDLLSGAGAFASSSISRLMGFLQTAVNAADKPPPERVGFLTTSGGIGVLMADALDRVGLTMPTLSTELQAKIQTYAPFAHTANPIDTTAQLINEPAAFTRMLSDCTSSSELDLVAVFIAHGLAGLEDRTLRHLVDFSIERGEASAGCQLAVVGLLPGPVAAQLQAVGVSSYTEPAAMAEALQDNATARAAQQALRTRSAAGQPRADDTGLVSGQRLDELAAKQLLARRGVTIPDYRLVRTADEAAAGAAEIGFPVALKLVSSDLVHKARVGGVVLHVTSIETARKAYEQLAAIAVKALDPAAAGEARIIVERQVSGRELFVGCTRHRELGVVVGVGAGGSRVEQDGAVRWTWAPVGTAAVRVAVEEVGGTEAHVAGVLAVANALYGVVMGSAVRTVETNPVLLLANGEVIAVDALVEVDVPTAPELLPQDSLITSECSA